MEVFEKKALDSYTSQKPHVWKRYDDTFVVIQSEFTNFFRHMNQVDTNINFTQEEATDNQLLFLGLKVEEGQTLSSRVYRKHIITYSLDLTIP